MRSGSAGRSVPVAASTGAPPPSPSAIVAAVSSPPPATKASTGAGQYVIGA